MQPFLDRGISRTRYMATGAALMAMKIGVDFAISKAFAKPYTPWVYFDLIDTPFTRPDLDPTYWFMMWAFALPFIAIGLFLTLLRLRDAGLYPVFALLFFAPFLNLVLFLVCSLVPGADVPPGPLRRDPGHRQHQLLRVVKAAAVGAACGIAAFVLGTLLVDAYGGAALLMGSPVICGFLSGYLYSRRHHSVGGSILAAMTSILFAGGVVFVLAMEGLFCLVMAAPLVVAGSLLGAFMGYVAQCFSTRGGNAPTVTAMALLPLTFMIEAIAPLPLPEPRPVESSIVIDAPAEDVWRHVIAFPPLAPPTERIFRMGIAAPVGATIEGEGVGAIRRCRFTTGDFIEPIEVWDPPRELTFSVIASPDPMRELTLWNGPRPPHLDGYLESTRGQFLLEPLPGGRTRLTGRTWYRTNMVPETYWRLWADPIIHTIHMRVLRHVAALAEDQLPVSD